MYISNDAKEDREKGDIEGSKEGEKSAGLRALAKQFTTLIQDHEFSPADLQEYLLVRKNDAATAVAELTAWVEEMAKSRTGDNKEVKHEVRREEILETIMEDERENNKKTQDSEIETSTTKKIETERLREAHDKRGEA